MEPCVVLFGDISSGYDIFGPFPDFDTAAAWCNEHPEMMTWIATLIPPEEEP